MVFNKKIKVFEIRQVFIKFNFELSLYNFIKIKIILQHNDSYKKIAFSTQSQKGDLKF